MNNKRRQPHKIDQPAPPSFDSRADRDAYYSARTLERQRGGRGGDASGGRTGYAAPAAGSSAGEVQTIEIPDSLLFLIRIVLWMFRKMERVAKLMLYVFAAMTATSLLGMLIGYLSI